jgi:processive 1,2-diacylglycerol beta-glucosyltransferase
LFLKDIDKAAALERLGLRAGVPTLLVLSGGLGFSALEKILQRLLTLKERLQIITVAGKNAPLRERLNRLIPPKNISIVNLGYVTNMHEIVETADLVVTKAGGLTVSECMVKGLPMVLVSPIPGQEEKNAEFVRRSGAGIVVEDPIGLAGAVHDLLISPRTMENFRHNARLFAKPLAAFTITDTLLRDLPA